MLDDFNVIAQRDPTHLLEKVSAAAGSLTRAVEIAEPEHDKRTLDSVLLIAHGEPAIDAATIACSLDDTSALPIAVCSGANLARYVGESTLVIIAAYDYQDGDTDLATLYQAARERNCQIAVVGNGEVVKRAAADHVVNIVTEIEPAHSAASFQYLRAVYRLLAHFGVTSDSYFEQLAAAADWLEQESASWHQKSPIHENFAKQFTLLAIGKSSVFYGGAMTYVLAQKCRAYFTQIAKNVAFSGRYPDFYYSELTGWSSHPIDKPYLIVDLASDCDGDTKERMHLADRMLSGMRPKAFELQLFGKNYLSQVVWLTLFAEYVSIYMAILNNSNPASTALRDKYLVRLAEQD